MPERIERDVVAILSFTVADEETSEILEDVPQVAYLHGHGNLPEAVEGVLEGLADGASFDEVVPLAFGEATGATQSIRRGDLPRHLRDRARPGASFAVEGSDGSVHTLWVTEARGGRLTVTTDHPFAGRKIRLSGQVLQLRPASASELEHGHAHGPGESHHH
ncbi:MAG TPA: hypothetical protein ENK18_28125 [Deltaproteobacteria bacterium]|nr:hypothetical protein [Deltaproteobacteria bacterium]